MRRRAVVILLMAMAGVMMTSVTAQRRITPVEPRPTTPGVTAVKPEKDAGQDRTNVAERRDASGNVVFVDTVTGKEWVDTTLVARKDKRMIYHRFHSVNVGVNIWDPVMKIFGSGTTGIGVWGQLNMHNRYFPTLELGVASFKDTPDDMNYTYHSKVAPYVKLGCDYNIFYNNSPDYQLLVGVRYGLSMFNYELTDCVIDDGYWPAGNAFSMPSQRSTTGYFEGLVGVKVKIVKQLSLGWTARFHAVIHETKNSIGKPMFIPGFGNRNLPITGTFSVIYTIGLNTTATRKVSSSEE